LTDACTAAPTNSQRSAVQKKINSYIAALEAEQNPYLKAKTKTQLELFVFVLKFHEFCSSFHSPSFLDDFHSY
jgi:hypothetical protein